MNERYQPWNTSAWSGYIYDENGVPVSAAGLLAGNETQGTVPAGMAVASGTVLDSSGNAVSLAALLRRAGGGNVKGLAGLKGVISPQIIGLEN